MACRRFRGTIAAVAALSLLCAVTRAAGASAAPTLTRATPSAGMSAGSSAGTDAGSSAGTDTTSPTTPPPVATVVTFSRWTLFVLVHSKQVRHDVDPGATFQRCASQRLVKIEAHYTATGPSSRSDTETWQLNGKFWDRFTDRDLGRSGAFAMYSASSAPLPTGVWRLTIRYGGKQVGDTAVRIVTKRHC
jgi:hypothetical protein